VRTAAWYERNVILVIDTSSARAAIALLDAAGKVVREETHPSGPSFDLPARYRALAPGSELTKVAVATGPGSFTGLRVGVSFGLGLAMGLRIPIVPLRTLDLQAARSNEPVLAVSEAGRGRVYFRTPAGQRGLGAPGELPRNYEAVGWLRPETEQAMVKAGIQFRPETTLKTFGEAAAQMLPSAPEVAYGSLRLEYMQSFSATRN
jgi:tRNA threonylcarbamoyl adenosine modification protein YeaZ